MEQELAEEGLPPALNLAFRLGIAGLLGERNAEVRLDLSHFRLDPSSDLGDRWRDGLLQRICCAFLLLVRKDGGWSDIDQALEYVQQLRQEQKRGEARYLEQQPEERQPWVAVELLALYHALRLISLVGSYLLGKEPGSQRLRLRLDRHHSEAVTLLLRCQLVPLAHLVDLLWLGCHALVQNALWTHAERLDPVTRAFIESLTSRARAQPVLELWPGQQQALERHLLDTYRRAIVVEMPTSGGKTLLAKFVMLQTRALQPEARIAYVVPTRALVNQITLDLRHDFQGLELPGGPLHIEQTVPAFELDPTEGRLLTDAIDVLVTTPEKLDLLIRARHPVVRDLALIIVDEAHNLGDGDRGLRLELLLGMIKRDFPRSRFLLLSPFVPNADELLRWLGNDRSPLPIVLDWKPGRKVTGLIYEESGRQAAQQRSLIFETVPSIHSTEIEPGQRITLGPLAQPRNSKEKLSAAAAAIFAERGSVLVLCRGPLTAVKRARQISRGRQPVASHELLDATCHYIAVEQGPDSPLIACLERGVAYHHSGLSPELRWLIEDLIRAQVVHVVCGTTTLAQGVHFPIATVVIETLKKGSEDLSFQDFGNIAGRAGRTLIDSIGIVALPVSTSQQKEDVRNFLRQEAQQVISQLIEVLARIDSLEAKFTIDFVRKHRLLSPLLQFIAHAVHLFNYQTVREELEDLIQSSLAYHQLRKKDEEALKKLFILSHRYLETLRTNRHLALADQTGFSTPSVNWLLAQRSEYPELTQPENWQPDHLFRDDPLPLFRRLQLIAQLPEIDLSNKRRKPLSLPQLAQTMTAWVNGQPLHVLARLAEQQPASEQASGELDTDFFSQLSLISWGMGALETIYLSGQEAPDRGEAPYVPAMLYFGVRRKEAVWLRMSGVPRPVAEGLAQLWKKEERGEPANFSQIRRWVNSLSEAQWQEALARTAPTGLTARDLRVIWGSLTGESRAR
ncbi:DEAD/DEAH box helicase [Thermogemmatispora carboxidivorans]|uniref:DEAD/DEAH box helicase n=1 Tax=Thermogemmatispora carboxidivorans TaxID=1382306 RepID=UPI001EE23B05|nr:DEAD/DEAH box helicase [Thermogemmatispora carboxidivorans]